LLRSARNDIRKPMTELTWEGKYDTTSKKIAPVRIALPFQTIETVNESAQDRLRTLDLFARGKATEWRNRLIWGDKKYVLPSLLPEFAGKVNLIYIDPPFDTGADFSFTARIPTPTPSQEGKPTSPSSKNPRSSNKKPTATPGAAASIPICNGFMKQLWF
jgi:hypothetical protein